MAYLAQQFKVVSIFIVVLAILIAIGLGKGIAGPFSWAQYSVQLSDIAECGWPSAQM